MMLWLLLSVALFLPRIESTCLHEDDTLQRWSDMATWNNQQKPIADDNVLIDKPILLDETDLDLGNITIDTAGRLVFDPEVDIKLRVANIYVYGALEIGSEACLHTGQVTITIKGTRDEHALEVHPKVILVDDGGTLEIHGQRKLTWTKITQTVRPPTSADVLYEHKENPTYESEDSWKRGLVAYTFTITNNQPVVKQFGAYQFAYKENGKLFADQMDNAADGDIVMVTTQRYVNLDDSTQNSYVYDAIERLVYGEVNQQGTMRHVSDDGETYGFIYQKGNPESFVETNRPLGEGCKVQFIWDNQLVFTAETGSGRNYYYQVDNFIVQTVDSALPKLTVIDDVSTWLPGDKVVLASTDFDWRQAEERDVIQCDTCASNELRVNAPFQYTHYGEVIRGAIDMRAEVALINRNIVIEGEMEDTCPSGNENCDETYVLGLDTFGAHVKVLSGYASVHIEGAELRFVGQQTDLGRYPIHFHMCLDAPANDTPYIREVSIHHSFARCVTIHGSHGIQVVDTFCYDHMGHGYYLEDGAEKGNVFDGNLAIGTRKGTGSLEPLDSLIPASFWITNPNVIFKNNVAAGGDGTGIWIVFPDKPLGPSASLGIMDEFEARHTPITELDNNVAHSNVKIGFQLALRLGPARTLLCCNHWQPKVNPKDPSSENIEVKVSRVTGYKNRNFNAWIQGGLLNVSHISVSDSLNGIMVDNEGMLFDIDASGRLMKSVIIGYSENLGEPLPGAERSYAAYYDMDAPQTGLTLWHGPLKADDIWFDGFEKNSIYDTGAIGLKRPSPYFLPMVTELSGMQFAFDDDITDGTSNMNIAGVAGVNDGWEAGDAEHAIGYTWNHDLGTGMKKHYVVKGDHFSAAASDCKLRTNWRMAVCETKYGNLRLRFRDVGGNKGAVFVRDSLPSAQQNFQMEFTTGPQVVLDGSETYTVHFVDATPGVISITGEGMETGDVLRIGVCLPPDAEFKFYTYHPYRIYTEAGFVEVASLAELDATSDDDGKKYYFDETTGMLYYKFISFTNRGPDEVNTCSDGICPHLQILITSSHRTNADCRQRLYGDLLQMALPTLPTLDGVITSNAATNPPSGWGAGLTRPFTNRAVVNGAYSDWSSWSPCTVSCAGGEQTRIRLCNDPLPANGGNPCEGPNLETQRCSEAQCPQVNGGFTEWTQWTTCTLPSSSECKGYRIRSRECSNPTPRDGGDYCTGSLKDMEPCLSC